MAYNLGIEQKAGNDTRERDVRLAVENFNSLYRHIPAENMLEDKDFNTTNPDGTAKPLYYMEWWKIGEDKANIEMGSFHHNDIREFVKMFLRLKKYTIVYLERASDKRVLMDNRGTLR